MLRRKAMLGVYISNQLVIGGIHCTIELCILIVDFLHKSITNNQVDSIEPYPYTVIICLFTSKI